MKEARAHLDAVTQEGADPSLTARRAAARRRGAEQRLSRLEAAVKQIPEVTATKKRSGAKDATALGSKLGLGASSIPALLHFWGSMRLPRSNLGGESTS